MDQCPLHGHGTGEAPGLVFAPPRLSSVLLQASARDARNGIGHRRGLLRGQRYLGHAAAPDMGLAENVVLTGWATQNLLRGPFVAMDRAREVARCVIEAFDVRARGVESQARTLSGGNLQKFVVGREILREPGLLVVNQPTWGVDAATCKQAVEKARAVAARAAPKTETMFQCELRFSDCFENPAGGYTPRPAFCLRPDGQPTEIRYLEYESDRRNRKKTKEVRVN